MKTGNLEIKKVMQRVKDAQGQLQQFVKSQDWVEDARKYAKRQGKEMKKLIVSDIGKLRSFLEKEKEEIDRIHKKIPTELKKVQNFVHSQKREFDKMISHLRDLKAVPAKKAPAKKAVRKVASTRPASSTKLKASSKKKVTRSVSE